MDITYDLALKGPIGLYNRYFRTKKYCEKLTERGISAEEAVHMFRRNRAAIRKVTIPLAVIATANSYRCSWREKLQKAVGHFGKGFATSEFAQIFTEEIADLKGLKKYIPGFVVPLVGSYLTETLQSADILPGVFMQEDVNMEMLGASCAIAMEGFFDRKIRLAERYLQKKKNEGL